MKEIINIVMYKSYEDGKRIDKSCIFYSDGTVKDGSFTDGVNATKELIKELDITTEEFRSMLNKDTFYTMSEKQFRENYNSFLPQKVKEYDSESFAAAIERLEKMKIKNDDENIEKEPEIRREVIEINTEPETEPEIVTEPVTEPKVIVNNTIIPVAQQYDPTYIDPEDEVEDDDEIVVYEEDYEDNDHYIDFTQDEIDEEEYEEEVSEKDNSTVTKVIAGLVVVGTILGCGYIISRCSKEGTLKDIPNTTTTTMGTIGTTENTEKDILDEHTYVMSVNDNDLYNDYTYAELLNVTTNDFQKDSMIKVSSGLTSFNSIFANKYVESGHDIKAALTFDEVVALQQAYNNYTTDEVRAYFNGYEVDSVYMSNAYKSASLQLMGAYTIETSENPVDMSILIDSQEGIDFYNRYHAMYLAAKEAQGEEKVRLVNEFYKAVREDFAVTEEVRTEGISHADAHNSLKDYQLAVVPMIASAEMLFQKIDKDYTLNDLEIDFINDIGLCNHADDKFERLETITLTAYEDNENPLYEQYRNAIIAELVKTNEYVIDDAHRELTNLRRFQEVVNNDGLWKHRTTYEGEYGFSYTDYSEYTWEESSTEYEVEVETEVLPIPDDEKANVDGQIAQENEDAKKKAEEEAQAEAAKQQAEEDANKKAIEDEIKADEEQLKDDIDDINKTIDDNNKDNDKSNDKPVNENDYNNIDFDDEHSDDKGNLDSSVENVTIDGSGADEELPDPNEYGKDFDTRVPQSNYTASYIVEGNEEKDQTLEEWAGVDGAYIEYDMEYTQYDEDGNPIIFEEEGYQYTR